jgi:hypothetical protein
MTSRFLNPTGHIRRVQQPEPAEQAPLLLTQPPVAQRQAGPDLQVAVGQLIEALELACRVGKIARALTWDRSVRALGQDSDEEFASAPLKSLGSLLDDSYLGGA